MHPLALGPLSEVVLLGAHCDDIAIGAGATLALLARANPGLAVHALVMTGGGGSREDEERGALAALLPGAALTVQVLALPDGRLPEHWAAVKTAVGGLARALRPDLVLAPRREDAHQDHRVVGEIAPTAFRDAVVLGYEILKWEGDLGAVPLLHPVPEEVAEHKVAVLAAHYPSQADHDWFDQEAFLGLMRVRGVQCHRRYAEAFAVDKLVLSAEHDVNPHDINTKE